MLIVASFQKSLIVEQFQGNYLKSLSSNENKNELEHIMKIKHEVMLFTLDTQST